MKMWVSIFCLVMSVSRILLAVDSLVEMTVKLSPVGSYVAKTSDIQGSVRLDGNKVIATEVKVKTKTLKTGIALRDKHTQERLESDKFPEIILVSGEGESGNGKGKIKIRGIEKSVSGTYKVDGNKIIAQFKLSIKDFGIENVKYLGVGVKDEVEIKVQVPISK